MYFLLLITSLIYNIYDTDLYNRILPEDVIINEEDNFTYKNNFNKYFMDEVKLENDFARSFFFDYLDEGNSYYLVGAETKLREEDNISSLDAVIYKMSKEGKILKERKLVGSNEDSFRRITSYGTNKIIVSGITHSTNEDFSDASGSSILDSGFITLFDNNLEKLQNKSFGSFYDVRIEGLKERNGFIYLLFSYLEMGVKKHHLDIYDANLELVERNEVNLKRTTLNDFIFLDDLLYVVGSTSNKEYSGLPKESAALFILDFRGNVVDYKVLNTSGISNFKKIYNDEGSLVLVGNMGEVHENVNSKDSKILVSRLINNNLVYECNTKGSVRGITKLDAFYLSGTKYDEKLKLFIPKLFKLDDHLKVREEIALKSLEGNALGVFQNEHGLNVIMNTKIKKSETLLTNASLVNLIDLKIREDVPTSFSKELRYEKLSYLEEYNENLFGTYYLYDHYYNEFFNVYNHFREKRVRLKVNVTEKIYREPLTISSNSIMYLNEKKITNDYYLAEEGIYSLVCFGSNGETREIVFELVLDKPNDDSKDYNDNISNEDGKKEEEKEEFKESEVEKPSKEKEEVVPIIKLPENKYSLSQIDENVLKYLSFLGGCFILMIVLLINAIKR